MLFWPSCQIGCSYARRLYVQLDQHRGIACVGSLPSASDSLVILGRCHNTGTVGSSIHLLALRDCTGTFGQFVHARNVQHDGFVHGAVSNGNTSDVTDYAYITALDRSFCDFILDGLTILDEVFIALYF